MKNALIGLFSFMIILLAGFAINTSEGRTLRENELSSTVSSSMEKSMEILKLKKDYTIVEQKEFAADFIQNAMTKMNSKSKYDVEIITIDVEKGLLDAKVTETYKQFARPGKVSVRKTIILEDYQNLNNEYFLVTFQDKDGKIIKQMNVYGGSNMDVTLLPHEWKNMKFTCLESGIEYTIDTLSGLIVTSNLTFKIGEDSERPSFTVIYNSNGGSGKMDPSIFFIGESSKLKKNTYTRNGHVFTGWNTQPNGLGTSYIDEAEVKNMTSTTKDEIVLYAQWESKEEYYYIDYNANGGSGTMEPTKHIVGKGGVIEKNAFTYPGYVFKEWNTVKSGTGINFMAGSYVNFNLIKDKRVTLYAQWEKEPEYGIYFVQNPSASIVNEKYSAEATIKVTHPRDYIKHYKIWVDDSAANNLPTTWSDAVTDFNGQKQEIRLFKNNIEQIDSVQYVHFAGKTEHGDTVSGVINIPAKEIPKPYTVTYKANGGIGADDIQEVEQNAKWYVQGAMFTKEGYNLVSWNTNADGTGKRYEFNSYQNPLNENITLYAQWEQDIPQVYYVSYHSNGGSGSMSKSTHAINETSRLSKNQFIRTGYRFLGWAKDANAQDPEYQDQHSIYNLTTSIGSTVNLYAIWELEQPVSYTITYMPNGASGTKHVQEVLIGQSWYARGEIFARTGYTLESWNTDPNGMGTSYILDGWHSSLNSNLTLYAQWEKDAPKTYTVKYNSNGGAGTMDDSIFTINEYGYLRKNQFIRDGYTFLGWSTYRSDVKPTYYDGGQIYNLSTTDGSVITLYAIWEYVEPKEYTVTYKANGGAEPDHIQTVDAGSGYYLRGKIFTRNGYTLKSWNTDSQGIGTTYKLDEWKSSLNKNLILYAQWEKTDSSSHKITYNANGGYGSDQEQIVLSGSGWYVRGAIFTKTGFTLESWNTDPNGVGTRYELDAFKSSLNNDITLYAQWKAEVSTQYKITYISNTEFVSTYLQYVYGGRTWTSQGSVFQNGSLKMDSWNTSPTGDGTRYELNAIQNPIDKDITLYAQWYATVESDKYILAVEESENTVIPSNVTSIQFTDELPPSNVTTKNLTGALNGKVKGWFVPGTKDYKVSSCKSGQKVIFNPNSSKLFRSKLSLANIDFSNADTSNVTNMTEMFVNCVGLTSLDISNFDTRNVLIMTDMFWGMRNVKTIYVSDKWNTAAVNSSSGMFYQCYAIIGQSGYEYNPSYVNVAKANYQDGYFTYKPAN